MERNINISGRIQGGKVLWGLFTIMLMGCMNLHRGGRGMGIHRKHGKGPLIMQYDPVKKEETKYKDRESTLGKRPSAFRDAEARLKFLEELEQKWLWNLDAVVDRSQNSVDGAYYSPHQDLPKIDLQEEENYVNALRKAGLEKIAHHIEDKAHAICKIIVDIGKEEARVVAKSSSEEALHTAKSSSEEALHTAKSSSEEALHTAKSSSEEALHTAKSSSETALHTAKSSSEAALHTAKSNGEMPLDTIADRYLMELRELSRKLYEDQCSIYCFNANKNMQLGEVSSIWHGPEAKKKETKEKAKHAIRYANVLRKRQESEIANQLEEEAHDIECALANLASLQTEMLNLMEKQTKNYRHRPRDPYKQVQVA